MFCPKCGMVNDDESRICSQCRMTLKEPSTVKPKFKTHKKVIILGSIATVFVIAITFIVLVLSHIICINHEFSKATCTTPKTCNYCGEKKGKPRGHNWKDATCTEPQICQKCEVTKGNALGHTKGEWVSTKDATLVETGVEEICCSVCDESLDSRVTEKKKPKVDGTTFNFKDKEFIDWINDKTSMSVGYTELSLDGLSDMNTSYAITMSSGEVGIITLNHGEDGASGNICAIMVYFDDSASSGAIIGWLGEQIASDFSATSAFEKFVYGKAYISSNMTAMELELDDDFPLYVLAPTAFFEDTL